MLPPLVKLQEVKKQPNSPGECATFVLPLLGDGQCVHKATNYSKNVFRSFLIHVSGTLLVSAVTHRLKVFEKHNQDLQPHRSHPSITRIIQSGCSLRGPSEVGLRKDVTRNYVCIIPRTS